jgi:hypothetical protein
MHRPLWIAIVLAVLTASRGAAASTFPLHVSADKSYLVDGNGQPFLLQGDTAWELDPALSSTDVAAYLADRQSRGFNAVVVEVMEHKFTIHSPPWLDANGNSPFTSALGGGSCAQANGALCDFSTPNPAYFANLDSVIQQAQNAGIVVLLFPSYIGYTCQSEGWCAEMRANGTSKLFAYGQFLGQRYKSVPNIIWVEGGDYTPPSTGSPSDLSLVNAVATGIISGEGGGSGTHLQTAHWSQETSAADVTGLTWPLSIDTTYTYLGTTLYTKAESDTARDQGLRPAFLIESLYENEHSSTPAQLRSEMYEPILSGERGFVFGNAPLWFFSTSATDGNPGWSFATSKTVYPSWRSALTGVGTKDAARAGAFFRSIAWWQLQPDRIGTVLKSLSPSGSGVLASTADRRLAVAFFSASATATIDMSQMIGPTTARWFDPSSGNFTTVSGSPFFNGGTRSFSTPGAASDGSPTWLLVLQATPPGGPAIGRRGPLLAALLLAAGLHVASRGGRRAALRRSRSR